MEGMYPCLVLCGSKAIPNRHLIALCTVRISDGQTVEYGGVEGYWGVFDSKFVLSTPFS
jgi:hypothetical protein